MAALRSGAGLVTLGVPESVLDTVASFEPSYMTLPLPCDPEGRLVVAAKDRINELADQMACIACGTGLGRSSQVTDLVTWMYSVLPQPMVVDADALYAIAQHQDCLFEPAGPRILTPHPGEFQRLLPGEKLSREEQEQRARDLAATSNAVVLLKGHRTLITDGRRTAHNETGNPGMATGGCGDVLTGIITALVCQGLSPFDAARLAAHVHGLAGDLAADELGQISLIASDLLRYLPSAFRKTGTSS
jgi:NAD(P)H-hydrate epimerase